MDDYKIALGALLDANAKGDIDKQLKAIKDLSVTVSKATLDQSVINDIKRQLSQNGIDLKLVFGNVGQINSQAQQIGQQVGNNIGQQITQSIGSAIQKGTMQIVNGKDIKNLKEFKFTAPLQNNVAKQALKDFQSLGQGIVTVKEEMKNIDGKNLLNGFTINIKNAKGEVESLRYALKDIEGKTGQSFQYVGGSINDNGVIKQMNAISAKADSLQTKLDKLKANYSDVNASRPIKDSGNISALSQQYDKVAQAIENVRNADNATSSSMVSNAQREITTLESMVSQFRNAENVATQMKSVDISSGIAQAQERLAKLKANSSGFEQMTETIRKLDITIEGVGDKSSLDKFINDLRTAETQLSRVKAETKAIETARKEQEKYIETVRKGKELAKKQANDQFTSKQVAIYDDIKKNQSQIYSLKQKLLSADKLETEEINKQISALELKNKYNNYKLAKNGMIDNSLEKSVQESKVVLENQYKIVNSRKQDNAIAKETAQAEKERFAYETTRIKEANSLLNQQKNAYQEIWNINKKISSLDITKDANQISALNEKKKNYQEAYISIQKQLQGYVDIVSNEEKLKVLAEVRKKAEAEIAVIKGKQLDNSNAKESARIAKETAQAEKERLSALEKQRAVTANSAKEKAKSNAQQELAQQKEINAILSKQESAYKEIWNINKQIATLDPTKNSDQISALNEKKKFYQEIYLSAQKELQAYNNITVSQEHLVSLAEIRKKAESEIGVTVARQNEALTKAQADQVNKIKLLSNGGIKNDYPTQIAKLEGNFRSLGLAQDTIATKTQNVKNSLATLRAEFAKPVDQQNLQTILTLNDNLQRELAESTNEYTRLQASMKGMATEQQRLSLANTIEAWNQKNTAATKAVREENERYIISLRDLSNQMTRMDFNKINTGFKQNENSMRALNRLGASLKDQFAQAYRSFTMWLSASTMVMKVISETREAISQLKEVDTILTEISKTNHSLTSSDLTKIADNGFDVASKYGKTVTDYLSGVKDMSRAGYRNAEAMGELSTAVQGAGDMTADVANKMIIATDKAYKLGGSVEELTKILDGMNWISDNNAVNMTELSEGMSIVGSTAASFGVEVNELTAALATMTASTQQSGSEVARAFRAILLNIRQVSDEEEGIDAEGLTKYEKACNALGVSLKETVNGVLQTRDAMEVLEDLSVAYNKLDANDLRRTNLLNSVGGKSLPRYIEIYN